MTDRDTEIRRLALEEAAKLCDENAAGVEVMIAKNIAAGYTDSAKQLRREHAAHLRDAMRIRALAAQPERKGAGGESGEYTFRICYGRSVIDSHAEAVEFKTQHDAFQHFKSLLKKFKVDGGTYYLCKWGRTKRSQP